MAGWFTQCAVAIELVHPWCTGCVRSWIGMCQFYHIDFFNILCRISYIGDEAFVV